MKAHAAFLPAAPDARADYKISASRNYGTNKLVHVFGTITAITVKKDDDGAIRREGLQAGAKRAPVTASRLMNNASSGGTSDCCRLVRASIVYNDDFGGEITGHCPHYIGNRFFFVEGGDYY
jgi:hypothetical protein